MSRFAEQIKAALRGRHPIIYLRTSEEDRACDALIPLAKESFPGGTVTTWSCVSGLTPAVQGVDTRDPVVALRQIVERAAPGFYVMKDLPAFFDDPRVVRSLRDVYNVLSRDFKSCVVIVSPVVSFPDTLEKELCYVELDLPSAEELLAQILEVQKKYPAAKMSSELQSKINLALRGFTLKEVEHIMHRAFSGGGDNEKKILEEIFAEKGTLAKKSGYLEFVPSKFELGRVGGLDVVKDWALKRKSLFTQDAVAKGLPIPKGVLIMGISGCGKSMLAKAIAGLWEVPLFRLDMSLIFSGIYGSPEAAFSKALRTIENLAPVVVWIDEIESSLNSPKDAATAQARTFSAFLTWMQEKPPLVFVAATANRIDYLPAEIIRKGRFDQVFFCDLPEEAERQEIIEILLKQNGAETADMEMDRLLVQTEGWSGAEIEQAIIGARIDALQAGRAPNTDDIWRHTTSMVPLSKTMAEQIKAIREWAFRRATRASTAKKTY